MLHVTNGESAVRSLQESRLGGTFLSWIDVLHDGPVPSGITDDELARVRAAYFESLGWSSYAEALHGLQLRNLQMFNYPLHDEIVLWFEHDLFDQLQLIQVLDWLSRQELGQTGVSLINVGTFPGIAPFHGLGQLTSEQLESLFPQRTPVSAEQYDLAREAWEAFRSPTPSQLVSLVQSSPYELPFLQSALQRWLEEFPSVENGLSRSCSQLLHAAADGVKKDKRDLYVVASQKESAVYMGDASAYWRIDWLATSPPKPALRREGDYFSITDYGRALLENKADWLRDRENFEFWMGGVRFVKGGIVWRWDWKNRNVIAGT
jgi:hypothetical protein